MSLGSSSKEEKVLGGKIILSKSIKNGRVPIVDKSRSDHFDSAFKAFPSSFSFSAIYATI